MLKELKATGSRYRFPYLLMGLLLCADATSYLCEKAACNHISVDGWRLLWLMLRQPFFWASMAIGPIQLLLWTTILGRVDLSSAYPISGLNMPLTLLAATFLLGEKLSLEVWLGAALITVGGAIIGPGSRQVAHPPLTPPG